MKYRIAQHRLTIPQEIRELAQIPRNGIIEIYYDEKTGNVIISKDLKDDEDVNISEAQSKQPKSNSNLSSKRKIEANFMDASNLYRQCFSKCGLVVRTKPRYVNDFCEECKGQLAKEWDDRVEVNCDYLTNANQIHTKRKRGRPRKEHKEQEVQKSVEKQEKVVQSKQRTLDTKEQEIVYGKRKKKAEHGRHSTGETEICPVKYSVLMQCTECKEFYNSGFMLDDDFVCKDCAKKDFEIYLRELRGK